MVSSTGPGSVFCGATVRLRLPEFSTPPSESIATLEALLADQLRAALSSSTTLSPTRLYWITEGDRFRSAWIAVLTFTSTLESAVPPGPLAVRVYVVVCLGSTDCSPELATVPTGLISTWGASDEVHLSWDTSPQFSCAVLASSVPVGLATATVALATPAVNLGTVVSFSPRCQATIFVTPWGISTMVRSSFATLTEPDQMSLSCPIIVTSYVPGG